MTAYELTQRAIFTPHGTASDRVRCPDCDGAGVVPDGNNNPARCTWCYGEMRDRDGYSTVSPAEAAQWQATHRRQS